MELKFLGRGGAFDDETNSSAYLETKNGILFIDMGENVFEKAKGVLQSLNKESEIAVAITHTHSDHVGSLGTFILFCHYILKKEVNLYYGSEEQLTLIKGLLDAFGVQRSMYATKINYFNGLNIDFVKTTHVDDFDCFGILIGPNRNNTIYYSGDSNSIPAIVQREMLNGNVKKFYQDITLADYPGNVHYNLDKFVNDFPVWAIGKTDVHFYHNTTFDPTKPIDISKMKSQPSSLLELTIENASELLNKVFNETNLRKSGILNIGPANSGIKIKYTNGEEKTIKFGDKFLVTQIGCLLFFE